MLNETNVSILYLSNYDIIAYYYNIKYITSYVILFIIDWCDAYDIIVQTNGTIDITCSIIGIMSLLYDIIILSLFYDFIWGNYDISYCKLWYQGTKLPDVYHFFKTSKIVTQAHTDVNLTCFVIPAFQSDILVCLVRPIRHWLLGSKDFLRKIDRVQHTQSTFHAQSEWIFTLG